MMNKKNSVVKHNQFKTIICNILQLKNKTSHAKQN